MLLAPSHCVRARPAAVHNREFWSKKLTANVKRDLQNVHLLREYGFDVLVIWECQLDDPDWLSKTLRAFWFEGDRR